MDLAVWLAFAGVSAVVVAIPGPTVLFVLGAGLRHGTRGALAAAPGVALGDVAAMTASMAGIGALLAASATAFSVVKLIGAGWLAVMGLRMLRDSGRIAGGFGGDAEALSAAPARADRRRLFRNAFLITLLNPKSLMFFVAFAPQFLDPGAAFLPQAAAMIATFTFIAWVNAMLWGLAAGGMRARLARPSARRWLGRAGGGCLLAASAATAMSARS